MDVAPVLLLGSIVYSLTQFAKGLRGALSGGDWNAPATTLSAYVIGVATMFAAGTATIVGSVTINGSQIVDLSAGDKVLIGLVASSLFGAFHDLTKALDGTQSAATPKLLPGNSPPQD
jgi:hypothetical protein